MTAARCRDVCRKRRPRLPRRSRRRAAYCVRDSSQSDRSRRRRRDRQRRSRQRSSGGFGSSSDGSGVDRCVATLTQLTNDFRLASRPGQLDHRDDRHGATRPSVRTSEPFPRPPPPFPPRSPRLLAKEPRTSHQAEASPARSSVVIRNPKEGPPSLEPSSLAVDRLPRCTPVSAIRERYRRASIRRHGCLRVRARVSQSR